MAKEFLSRERVPHTLKRLDNPDNLAEIKRRWGFVTAPIVFIGDEAFPGFEPQKLKAALKSHNLFPGANTTPSEVESAIATVAGDTLSGRLAVANFYGDALTFLEPAATNKSLNADDRFVVPLPGHPSEVAVSAQHRVIAVMAYAGATVTFLSLDDGRFLHGTYGRSTRSTGGKPLGSLAHPTEPLLFVGTSSPDSLIVFNLATGEFANGTLENSRINLPDSPYQCVYNPREDVLYVGLQGSQGVAVFEGRTAKPWRGDLEASLLPTGGGRGIALSHDGKSLYRTKSRNEEGFLALYDAFTGAPKLGSRDASWRPTGALPLDMTAHPTLPIVYVSSLGARRVGLHNGDTGDYLFEDAERSMIEAGAGVRGLSLDPRNDTLYATSFDEDTVTLINARTGAYRNGSRSESTVAAGRSPLGVVVLPLPG